MIGALLIGAGALWLISRKRNGVSGIGATKRRIYKELSLAQQAGVDFTKPYDELSKDEVKALERVSHDTGYTETYYKSLQKAYNAISGLGEAYDVVNADGETVLTWIEDPDGTRTQIYRPADDAERYAALREAHDIEDERLWAENNRAQAFEEREARLAEQRKRLRKSGRTTQMSLFGCNGADVPNYSLSLLNRYLSSNWVEDVQVVLNDTNKNGWPYVLCGDGQGGRDFYISPKNIQYLREYCRQNDIEYDQFYLPADALRGCGYAPEVEAELYEIWREQIEYGETDYDYDTWREVVGDEYARQDVLPYMRP